MVNSNIMQNHNQLTVATGQPSWLGWQRVLPCRGSWMSMFLLSHCGGRRTCSARMDHLAGKTWAWRNLCSIKQRWGNARRWISPLLQLWDDQLKWGDSRMGWLHTKKLCLAGQVGRLTRDTVEEDIGTWDGCSLSVPLHWFLYGVQSHPGSNWLSGYQHCTQGQCPAQ